MRLRELIDELLPAGWEWEGKRVLDFGCGSARVLRHFSAEAEHGEFWGCDIDERSIEWDQATLSPPFRFFRSALQPPLQFQAASLDLVWAMSVFTHIADDWNEWLAEMHRVLSPGGILIASFLGKGMWQPLVGEPYRESEVGMAVLHHWEGPDAWVFHSEWWLREHWGRAFDVLAVRHPNPTSDGSPQITHSYITLRRRDVAISAADLARIQACDAREIAGLQNSLRLARRELSELAARGDAANGLIGQLRARRPHPRRAWERLVRRVPAG
jgi:SAM-dependent methyltransferase